MVKQWQLLRSVSEMALGLLYILINQQREYHLIRTSRFLGFLFHIGLTICKFWTRRTWISSHQSWFRSHSLLLVDWILKDYTTTFPFTYHPNIDGIITRLRLPWNLCYFLVHCLLAVPLDPTYRPRYMESLLGLPTVLQEAEMRHLLSQLTGLNCSIGLRIASLALSSLTRSTIS